MPKLEVTIGEKEKHNIRIEASIWTGRFSVYVDEKEVSKSHGKIKDKVILTIGDKEKHEIEASSEGIFFPRINLFVDGKLIATT